MDFILWFCGHRKRVVFVDDLWDIASKLNAFNGFCSKQTYFKCSKHKSSSGMACSNRPQMQQIENLRKSKWALVLERFESKYSFGMPKSKVLQKCDQGINHIHDQILDIIEDEENMVNGDKVDDNYQSMRELGYELSRRANILSKQDEMEQEKKSKEQRKNAVEEILQDWKEPPKRAKKRKKRARLNPTPEYLRGRKEKSVTKRKSYVRVGAKTKEKEVTNTRNRRSKRNVPAIDNPDPEPTQVHNSESEQIQVIQKPIDNTDPEPTQVHNSESEQIQVIQKPKAKTRKETTNSIKNKRKSKPTAVSHVEENSNGEAAYDQIEQEPIESSPVKPHHESKHSSPRKSIRSKDDLISEHLIVISSDEDSEIQNEIRPDTQEVLKSHLILEVKKRFSQSMQNMSSFNLTVLNGVNLEKVRRTNWLLDEEMESELFIMLFYSLVEPNEFTIKKANLEIENLTKCLPKKDIMDYVKYVLCFIRISVAASPCLSVFTNKF